MTTTIDEDQIERDPIPEHEKEFAVLEPQQHSLLAHGFAQSMLLASLNKRTGVFGVGVDASIKAAVHLGSHVLDPQTLNAYYETYCQSEGRNNPYRDAVRIKAQRMMEEQA